MFQITPDGRFHDEFSSSHNRRRSTDMDRFTRQGRHEFNTEAGGTMNFKLSVNKIDSLFNYEFYKEVCQTFIEIIKDLLRKFRIDYSPGSEMSSYKRFIKQNSAEDVRAVFQETNEDYHTVS